MFRRTMMASAIALLTAPVTAAAGCPRTFVRNRRRRFAMPRPLMAPC